MTFSRRTLSQYPRPRGSSLSTLETQMEEVAASSPVREQTPVRNIRLRNITTVEEDQEDQEARDEGAEGGEVKAVEHEDKESAEEEEKGSPSKRQV